ncbi:hypothetical protein [Streptomyces prunicolor]
MGKVAKGAFKGVKIPMNVLDFGAKAADPWRRADDILEHAGGAVGAKNLYKEGMRHATEEIQHQSEKVHEGLDRARDTAGDLFGRAADVNPFG